MTINPKVKAVVVGVTIELDSDEYAHMSYLISDYLRLLHNHGSSTGSRKWPWAEEFYKNLEAARNA